MTVKYEADHKRLVTLADTKSAWEKKKPAASEPLGSKLNQVEHNRRETGLSTFFSVPIIGCDLLSSCLYTAGSVATFAGKVNNKIYVILYLIIYKVSSLLQ